MLAAIVVVVAACLAGIGCVVAQMRCADAAREAARLAGRGDSAGAASAVGSIAPAGAVLSVQMSGDLVTATVTIPKVSTVLPGVSIRASATAHREDGTGG